MARSTRSLRVLLAVASTLAVLLALAGCASGTSAPSRSTEASAGSSSAFPITVTDDASRTVTIDEEPARIVSLAPANTEILYALGLEDRIVGVTTYCDYPPEAAEKPKVGDFVSPNLEAVAAARPDLVFATGGVQADMIAKLEELGAKVVVLDPQSVEGVRDAIELSGRVTGAVEESLAIDEEMRAVIDDVASAAPAGAAAVRTFIEIGQNPLFTAGPGTLLDDMVRIAHGTNVVTQPGYVAYSLEQLAKEDPEAYLATKGSMSDPSDLAKRPGYGTLSAVENGRVHVLDDNLVTRPGPRVVEGLRAIAEALHPEWYGQ